MINYIRKKIKNFLGIEKISEGIDEIKFLVGKNLLKSRLDNSDIGEIDLSVFSQNEEDGIIQYIVNKINLKNKFFVEIGCSNYKESNTRFLLFNNNWSGIVVDSSIENINEIKNSYYFWKKKINALQCFVNTENISSLLSKYSSKKIGLLSIDIDGNDYWILKKIIDSGFTSDLIICEYNSLLGSEKSLSKKYTPNFARNSKNLINYGASIRAFYNLLYKEYKMVYGNKVGNNIFFLNKKFEGIRKKDIKDCYHECSFDETLSTNSKKKTFKDLVKLIKIDDFIDV